MRLTPLKHVKENDVLAQDIYTIDGRILLRKGTPLSLRFIGRIASMGIQSVYLQSELDLEELHENIDPALRISCIGKVKDSYHSFFKKEYDRHTAKRYSDQGIAFKTALGEVSNHLLDHLLTHKQLKVSMVDIKNISEYIFQHSVNTAVLSMIIGIEMGMSEQELNDLAIGALMLDVGNKFIEAAVLNQEEPLQEGDWEEIKKHPMKGFEYVRDNTTISSISRLIILEHHEHVDGSGYPRGLKGSDISLYAKIVTIADVYDAMTSDRGHRGAHTPSEALEYIMGQAGRKFDFDIANIFARTIVPYPVGTYVELSNGVRGVVVENHDNYPLRPKVRVNDYKTNRYKEYDLMSHHDIVITRVVHALYVD